MEEVIVCRAPDATDDYGNPIEGDPVEWRRFQALVAPNHGGEAVEVGRHSVITGYTVYVENQGATGILDTDLIRFPTRHGLRLFPVEGIVAEWRKRSGEHKGDQFAVKVVQG